MASSPDFVSYICEQLSSAGTVTSRKMFGEYGLYCDGKFFALICDGQLFIKVTDSGREFLPDRPLAPPYDGAKDHLLITDPDNRETLCELTRRTCAELPAPKPKKPRSKQPQATQNTT